MKKLLGIIIFIGIFTLIFAKTSDILEFKSLAKPWNMTLKVGGFYNEPENSMDVMFFGSSHMYCTIDPLLFQKETGLSSYVFATQKQPLWITYHYMKEALKHQKPEKIFMEIQAATFEEDYVDEGTNYSAIDPIPFSLNKLSMIDSAVPKGSRHEYVFNIIKYHSRWEELTPQDYDLSYKKDTDPERGFVRLTEAVKNDDWNRIYEDVSHVSNRKTPTDKNLEYLNKIVALAKENNIALYLFKSPSNPVPKEKEIYNYVEDFCGQKGIPFVDFNLHHQAIGLSVDTDFYDRRHLNTAGVEKFVPYFCRYFEFTK